MTWVLYIRGAGNLWWLYDLYPSQKAAHDDRALLVSVGCRVKVEEIKVKFPVETT